MSSKRRLTCVAGALALFAAPAGSAAQAAPTAGGAAYGDPTYTAAERRSPEREQPRTVAGPRAVINRDGTASAPAGAPAAVRKIIAAANEIATKPYRYGGGHRSWKDTGYDCSGSVSYALYGARLLGAPRASGGFTNYGVRGAGRWVTIYANAGHMYMVVAGLRFDTSGRDRAGTRWQTKLRPTSGYAIRHPKGL